jgi:hypothetical protein
MNERAPDQRPQGSPPGGPGQSTAAVATRPATAGDDVSVLDLAALIAGAAVAAVHLRRTGAGTDDAAPAFLFWLAFAGITISASGPLVALTRRLKRTPARDTGWGERLWVILGLPWLATALLRNLSWAPPGSRTLYDPAVLLAVSAACACAFILVWKHWVGPAALIERDDALPRWSERLGVFLGVTWPLQYGFAMIAVSL